MPAPREKAIPADAVAKPLAERLRALRRRAGSPPYRRLGALAHISHNALSQAVDGRYVRWSRVEQYLTALNRHRPGCVTDEDVRELRRLHRLARERRGGRGPARVRWELAGGTDHVIATAAEEAAASRAPGRWNTTDCTPAALRTAATPEELAGVLRALLARKRPALLPADPDARTDGDDSQLVAAMVAGGTPPAPHLIRQAVQVCGGTDGDCLAWIGAWERVAAVQRCQSAAGSVVPLAAPSPGPGTSGRAGSGGAGPARHPDDGHESGVVVRLWSRLRRLGPGRAA